ncbi:enoyl-CoA hydratase/isomerase family protein [Curtobacterium sp. MCBD17_013]|uniref:enoyl-CoA hydratase/isomerase family protein n=1 Tax=Curtobacterium sp. MCBD17_013 TaxID=2175668 RepID=UPI000DA8179A|nr:enoyl-CoA hydratase-related protein [Curtobacterium sp. MCBD17_013]PZF66183.1 enoyl-CoA hydratase/isomerase family protein [Curtobacterium sp. MCBD17_013]
MSSPGSDPAPVRVERPAPGVVVATLDRPDAGNALDVAMVQALEDLADAVRADVDVRVLVIGASGSAFSLGHDVAESADRTDATVPDDLDRQERTADALAAIRALRVPVVAAVGGPAAGTGLALALVADIRLAGPDAVFQASFTALGTSTGEYGVSWLLPRLVGPAVAADLAFTARAVDADEAAALRLVNRVVPDVDAAALELARTIAANSPAGVRLSKRAMQANLEVPSYDAALELENRGQTLLTRTSDMAEALEAFLEKRQASFSNR